MKKYLQLAKKLNMEDAVLITPQQICFDKRVTLKCRWGCDSNGNDSLKCNARGTTFDESAKIVSGLTLLLFFFAFIFLDAPTDTDIVHPQEVHYSLPRAAM